MNTYWMSFVKNHKNVGVIITDARDEESALSKVKNMGLFPGGETALYQMDTSDPDAIAEIRQWGKDRLINPDDLRAANYIRIGDLPPQAGEHLTVICEQCAADVPHTH